LDRLITFALQQRVFVLALAIVLAIVGWNAWKNLPVEAFPDVQDVQVQIIAQAAGLAPEEMERTIALPIELEMGGVPRMTQLRSLSITGLSVVTLTFADGTADYFARQQVTERLRTVNLPVGVEAVLAPLTNAVGEIYRYVLEAPPEMPLTELRALQDWVIKPALRRTPGVADIVSFGGRLKEYQVRINPQLLRKFGITIDQVAQALSTNSVNTGGGIMERGEEALVVRGIGIFNRLEDIARVVVASRQGRPIQVADVATVAIGYRPLSGLVGFNDRDDVVQGIVQMTKGQNASVVVDALKQEIQKLQPRLPPGVRLLPHYDRTQLVSSTVHTVTHNLLLGAVLVITILMIFLRSWYAAVAVAVIIPLSLLCAFTLMDARGVPANLISLGAVDFGIIVDSAVVVVEALMVRLTLGSAEHNRLHAGYPWRLHVLKSTAVDLARPILFSKAIIILAFMPIFTFQRVEGKIFTPMAYTLSFALLGAIILTLTLVPAILSFALQRSPLIEKHSGWMHWLQERYGRTLAWTGERRALVIGSSVALLAVTLVLAPKLGSEFLPKLDEGNIWLVIALPPSANIQKTKDVERSVRALLRSYPEVANVVTQVGRPDDGTDWKRPNNLEIKADLKPRDTWRFASKERMIADMGDKLRAIPGLDTSFSQVIEDNLNEAISGARGEIVIKIFGPDLDILENKSQQVVGVLNPIRGASDVGAFQIGGQTELTVTLDRNRMARYGINVKDVQDTIQTALASSTVNIFYEGDRRFDVTIRLDRPFRDAVDDVEELPIALPGGAGTIPLGSIADIAVKQGAGRISREAGGRYIAIKANLLGRDQGSFVAEAMAKVENQVKLPPGYYMTWGGQFENQQRATARLKVIIPISIFLIFILLFWAFRSITHALIVMLMVPFTLIGGLAGLAVAGLHLSISAAVGFIAVAGISVQNGVIMVEKFIENLRNGDSLEDAIRHGAVSRLRPIMMTAFMAGVGLLPAALSQGIGAETQRPFAVVIVGGIISATIFTLLLLPLFAAVFSHEQPETSDANEVDPLAPLHT
jgi:cobalt-zinc-cadmium resistance protein CzcA